MSGARGQAGLIDLASLALAPGAAHETRVRVELEPLVMGGQEYTVSPAELRLGVARSGAAFSLQLRGELGLRGACWRCLEPARLDVALDVREYSGDDPDDPDLACAYVDGEVLDLGSWSRDAIAEAVPPTILCREGCAGLCAACGADLNRGPCGCPGGGDPQPDPRWAGLQDVARRLTDDD